MTRTDDRAGTTLVTALVDIASREANDRPRAVGEYLRLGDLVLGADAPLVCYCDPELAPLVSARRTLRRPAASTLVVPLRLEETAAFRDLARIEAARSRHPIENANPAKDTPLYTALLYAKFAMLDEVAARNPFATTHCAWIDFGIAHVAAHGHVDEDRVFDLRRERISILMLRPWAAGSNRDLRELGRFIRGYVAAGFLAGPNEKIRTLCSRALETIDCALDRLVAPNDEQLLAHLVDESPDLFEPYPGDYREILENSRYLRGGAGNLRMQLAECLRLRDWRWAMEILRRIDDGLRRGSFRCDASLLAEILESCFVAAWNGEYPREETAALVARMYASRVAADPAFRTAFESRKDSVLRNFAFLRDRVEITTVGSSS